VFKGRVLAAASAAIIFGGITMITAGVASAAGGVAAQVEISGNCDNASFPLCAPPPAGVGLGGVWSWAGLDTSTGSGTFANPSAMDATATFCSHVIGGGGSHAGNGGPAGGSRDTFGVWYWEPSLEQAVTDAGPAAFPFYNTGTYSGPVYVLDYFPGSGPNDFIAVVPAQQGHYSIHPVPGVTINTQIAP
jgi:hypothetical protein